MIAKGKRGGHKMPGKGRMASVFTYTCWLCLGEFKGDFATIKDDQGNFRITHPGSCPC